MLVIYLTRDYTSICDVNGRNAQCSCIRWYLPFSVGIWNVQFKFRWDQQFLNNDTLSLLHWIMIDFQYYTEYIIMWRCPCGNGFSVKLTIHVGGWKLHLSGWNMKTIKPYFFRTTFPCKNVGLCVYSGLCVTEQFRVKTKGFRKKHHMNQRSK